MSNLGSIRSGYLTVQGCNLNFLSGQEVDQGMDRN